MTEKTIWLNSGEDTRDIKGCPYCGSWNLRIAENNKYGSCNTCEGNFNIRWRSPEKPAIRRKGISPEAFRQMLAEVDERAQREAEILSVAGRATGLNRKGGKQAG